MQAQIIKIISANFHTFTAQVGAHHHWPRDKLTANVGLAIGVLQLGNGARVSDVLIPCPSIVWKLEAGLGKEIFVVIEADRCEIFGNAI